MKNSSPHKSINEALKQVSNPKPKKPKKPKAIKEMAAPMTISSPKEASDLLTALENWIYSTVESLGYEDIQDFLEEKELEEAHAYMFKDIDDIISAIEYHTQGQQKP